MLRELGNGRARAGQVMLSATAVAAGMLDNVRYVHALKVKPSEYKRYFKKTAYLAMCYAGFAQEVSLFQARGAGKAAFLSCAYDVVTDWRKPKELQQNYSRILHRETTPELTTMALDLLNRDVRGQLQEDGLERGVVAIEFILQMMGVRGIFNRKCDIRQLGLNLQIVDDVLDYEDDVKVGDQNCLTNSERREDYLQRLNHDLGEIELRSLFPYGGLLIYAIKQARQNARNMLASPRKYFYTPINET